MSRFLQAVSNAKATAQRLTVPIGVIECRVFGAGRILGYVLCCADAPPQSTEQFEYVLRGYCQGDTFVAVNPGAEGGAA